MLASLEDEVKKARDVGLSYLSARARSVQEVREKLRQKRFSTEVIDQVVADLERLKLLDDRALARNWVELRMRHRPAGAFRFAQDLRSRGIDKNIIDEVLEEFREELDSTKAAVALLRRQRGRYAGLEETKAKRRMLGFLARRGYEPETAREAVEAIWRELQENDREGD